MKKALFLLIFVSTISVVCFISRHCENNKTTKESNFLKTSGAGYSMDAWGFERSYPFDKISTAKYMAAHRENKIKAANKLNSFDGEWESMGPINIGGRTLCLAFHPNDEDIIYAGSAGGGLWKTTSQGVGQAAWEYVPTGFPVMGVSTIVIDPVNPDNMLIGTGETYRVGTAEPGAIDRLTRGTYGIGILKTTDGGVTWSQSLPFEDDEIKGVQNMVIANNNPSEIYAATTNGLYQSLDGGDNWSLILEETMCMDVEIDPNDNDIIYVSHGNFNNDLDNDLCGIFKSTDKGLSFVELIDDGLIESWSGNAKISIDPTNSSTLYASIQVGWFNDGATTPAGLYKSTDAGINWEKINDQNIAKYQGWYSHDIAINPASPNEIVYTGIDFWKSTDTGNNFTKHTNWSAWTFGTVSVDSPEGGDNYVHADIHAVYYHPTIANRLFVATDGGVFSSDNGEDFTTHNGGLQTTQFFANMGSSATNPNMMIGGCQDNATYVYNGTSSWSRVIGGDGMCAAVNQENDNIVFGSYQRLGFRKSTNGGQSFSGVGAILQSDEIAAFSAPYEITPSDNDIMYAGAQYLYSSYNTGSSWDNTSDDMVDDGNVIVSITISPSSEAILFISTSPSDPLNGIEGAKVMKTINSGETFSVMTGLPDRICKDLAIDPVNENNVYAVFSGFGSGHLYKSEDGGDTWFQSDLGLPDVPTNTVFVDPNLPDHVYVGNDLSVYFSSNGGESWDLFNEELPEATMVMDLNYSPSNNKIRIATHGRGIYQRDLLDEQVGITDFSAFISQLKVYPNPASDYANIILETKLNAENVVIELINNLGQKELNIFKGEMTKGEHQVKVNGLDQLSSGLYFIQITIDGNSTTKSLIIK